MPVEWLTMSMSVDTSTRLAHRNARRHTSVVIFIWALIPVFLATHAALNRQTPVAILLAAIALTATGAAALSWSSLRSRQNLAVGMLIALSLPCLAVIAARFYWSFGSGLLHVAASPLAFLVGAMTEAVFVAPLPVLAVSVWRRRSGSKPQTAQGRLSIVL
jgi:hypothetical protein